MRWRGHVWWGACVVVACMAAGCMAGDMRGGGREACVAGEMATAVDGTHPT